MKPAEFCTIKPWGSEGVRMTYTRSRNTILVSGWYDSMVGIGEPEEVPLIQLFERLGIRKQDIDRAYREAYRP